MPRNKPSNIMTIISNNSSHDEFISGGNNDVMRYNSNNSIISQSGGMLSRRPEITLAAKTDRVHKIEKVEFISGGGGMNGYSNSSRAISVK